MKYGIPGVIEFDIYTKLDDWGRVVPADGSCSGGGGGGQWEEAPAKDPSGVALAAADECSGGTGGGGGGGGAGGCTSDWGRIEISYDGGLTWDVWYTVCES
jgi:hypothetical protein